MICDAVLCCNSNDENDEIVVVATTKEEVYKATQMVRLFCSYFFLL
jgi:coenzyme F420-reducing hydrogenase beta subunit